MNKGEVIIYQTSDGTTALDVRLEQETIWLTQKQIAQLFGVQQPAISKHLKNIFETGELVHNSVHSILEYTASDGKNYQTAFGSKRIGNNTLVALTLMIAESRTEEMDVMVKVIVNLINKNN